MPAVASPPTIRDLFRTVAADTVETNRRRRTVRAIWSAQTVDHFRTLFLMDGIDTSAFDKNPVILSEHGRSSRGLKPIAMAKDYGPSTFKNMKVFVGTARWWDGDAEADDLFNRYESGEMKGWSIRAIPREVRHPTTADRRLADNIDDCDEIYTKMRLLEVSACGIPGNEHTLTIGVERSLGVPQASNHPDPRIRYAAQGRAILAAVPGEVRRAIAAARHEAYVGGRRR